MRAAVVVTTLSLAMIAMLGAPAAVASPKGSGTTYYVATTGSNSNPGTLEKPWKTILKAITTLKAGDTALVRGGTYVERIMNPSINVGTSDNRITVKAYSGENPILQGLLWMTGASYWTFRNIDVTWDPATGQSSEHMVKFTNGVGWRFRNAEVWGAHSYAAILVYSSKAGEPSDWRIQYNCIHDTWPTNDVNQDHLIYVNAGLTGTGGLIRRNILFNATNGDGVKLGGSSEGSNDTANVIVRYNTIYNTSQNIRVLWTSHDNSIYRNIMDKVNLGISPNYGNVRGYQLTGANNAAYDNWGYLAKSFIYNDKGYTGVEDQGGNEFPSDPNFDSVTSCDGFHPSAPDTDAYGRYGHP
jgi:hypothetical protein